MTDGPTRIGIILTSLGGLDSRALEYLVLFQNTQQNSLEFQFLPTPTDDELIKQLDSAEPIDRVSVEQQAPDFIARYHEWLTSYASNYGIASEAPDGIVILSTAKFADYYYLTGGNNNEWLIIALGHWQGYMSPPSIVEFFLTLLVETGIDIACGARFPPRHHATKGCVFDFSASIRDVRWSVLSGFLCTSCCNTIKQVRSQQLVEDVRLLLNKEWLGDAKNPTNVANTAKKLGYDLFRTSGIKQTLWERVSATVEAEAVKNILMIIGTIVLFALLFWLGLKNK